MATHVVNEKHKNTPKYTTSTGNRSKMDKLVRVRRLLQRLDFLFQLPQKLEEAVQEGQYAKAIRYTSSSLG